MINYFIPKNAQDWNSFLIKKYEYGICNFSYCLAEMIIKEKGTYGFHPRTNFPRLLIKKSRSEYFREEIIIREDLKKRIIKTMGYSLRGVGWRDEYNFIVDIYDLEPFFKNLDKEIESFKPYLRKRGRPPEIRHRIVSIWAQVMKGNRGTNWDRIEYLYRWFFNKLKRTKYQEILGTDDEHNSDIDQFKFRNEYYVIKRNKQHIRNIEKRRERFFPLDKHSGPLKIEFKNDYIHTDLPNENSPLIIFPDGETFP